MLLQALDYRAQGHRNTEPFMETALAALRTPSGRRLGEAAMTIDPTAWWRAFAQAGAPTDQPRNGNGSYERRNARASRRGPGRFHVWGWYSTGASEPAP